MAAAGDDPRRARCELLEGKIRPGVTTGELDEAAEKFIRSQGATPAFKGYRGFPGSICASPNSMVVHGIPGPYRLERGDIISVDVGVDPRRLGRRRARARSRSARSRRSPTSCSTSRERRCSTPSSSAGPGNRLGDVSHAVQARVEAEGLAVVRSLVGHGIGRSMHEDPQVPNYGEPGKGPLLEEGMVLADRADGHRRAPRRAHGRRRLGDLLPGRLARGPFRVHDRHHRRRAADPHALARAASAAACAGAAADRLSAPLLSSAVPVRPGPVACARTRVVGSGGRPGSQSRCAGHRLERDHEGTTVGQADVREVQDHPPPRRGARDLPEPPPQAAAGVAAAWHESQGSTSR